MPFHFSLVNIFRNLPLTYPLTLHPKSPTLVSFLWHNVWLDQTTAKFPTQMGRTLSEEKVEAMIRRADLNEDGQIDLEEFANQGWKFMNCSHCQELGQQAQAGLWLATQEWTTNQKPWVRKWPNSWQRLQLINFRFRTSWWGLPTSKPPFFSGIKGLLA